MTVTVTSIAIAIAIAVAVAVATTSVTGEGIDDRSGRIDDDGAFGRLNWLDRTHNGTGIDIDHPVELWSSRTSASDTRIERLKRQRLPGIFDDRAARPGIEGLTTLLDRVLSDTAVLDSTAQLKTLRDVA